VAVSLAVYFHSELGIKYTSTALLVSIGLVFVFGGVWWWLARAVRKQQGIDLMLSYKTIPPE
jgi:hypothetical protein